jgi:hypothetical protein
MRKDATYEITWTPADGTALIYQSIPAGICGPFTGDEPAADRIDAEALALRFGLVRSGDWQTAANGYDYAPAVLVEA